MDSQEGLVPTDAGLLRTDTLSAVHRHRRELNQMFAIMPPGLTEKLVGEISNSPQLPNINFDHPFGYYKIPVAAVDFKSQIDAPIKIDFVPDAHPLFKGTQKIACYNPKSETAFLRETYFTPAKRILGWIIGLGVDSNAIPEELVEHEIRHGIFHSNVPEPHGGGLCNINEGFADATSYNPYSEEPFFDRLRFQDYHESYFDPIEIGGYCRIFQAAQAKGVDDVELLQYMNRHDWWANLFGKGWDLNRGRIKANVFKRIGKEGLDEAVRQNNRKKTEEMPNFRYCVWQHTLAFLRKNDLEPNVDWLTALEEEKRIREGWRKLRE